jgi:Phasin protein
MAEETGSFDSSRTAEPAAELTKRIQEMMAIYFGWFQNSKSAWGRTNLKSRLLSHATDHVSAASTFVSKLSKAADLQEVVKIQLEFVQTRMTMFNERTKEIGDAVAAATNRLGAFTSLLNWQKVLEDLASSSPTYRQTGGNERKRTWSAAATQNGPTRGSAGDDRKATRRRKKSKTDATNKIK